MKRILMIAMMVLMTSLLFNGCVPAKKDFDSQALYIFYGTVVSVDEDFTIVKFNRYTAQFFFEGQPKVEKGNINVEVKSFTSIPMPRFTEGQNVYITYLSEKRIDEETFRKLVNRDATTLRIQALPPMLLEEPVPPEPPENSPVGAK